MRVALAVTGGVDESARDKIIPALVWLIEQLARRHEVHVYALRYLERPATYSLLGATVHDLGRPEGIRRQYSALAAALGCDGPFDLLHAYWALPAGVAGTLAARRLGIPSIVTLDSGEFAALPDIGYGNQLLWRQRLAVSTVLRLASRLTVCTDYQRRLASAHGVNPAIIPWGIDATRFSSVERPEGPPWRLLHVGNLNPVKDQPLLLDAFALLRGAGVDAHLDIVGQDTLSGAIQVHAVQRGLSQHVTFHGFLPTDVLAPLFQRAHLSVVTSRHEAAGVVALEAAASSVPTIGTRVGYLADWTPDRAAVVERSAQALAAGIEAVLNDRSRRLRMANAARAWTLAHDVRWTAEQFDRLYEEVLHERAASQRQ